MNHIKWSCDSGYGVCVYGCVMFILNSSVMYFLLHLRVHGAPKGVLEKGRLKNDIPVIVSCSCKSTITTQQMLSAFDPNDQGIQLTERRQDNIVNQTFLTKEKTLFLFFKNNSKFMSSPFIVSFCHR